MEKEDILHLFNEYHEAIYRFTFFKVGNKEVAEDIVSTVFLKALEKSETFNPTKASEKTWLFTIAANTVKDHYKTYRHTKDIEDCYDLQSEEDVRDSVYRSDKKESVHRAMHKLNAKQRQLIILRVWEELSFDEIAQIVEQKTASCKMQFYRSLKILQSEIIATLVFYISNIFS